MTLAATTIRATGIVGVLCALLAIATLWLVFSEPVTVARVVQDGDLSALLAACADALARAFRAVARYL
jgi:hypothetical protein